MKKRILIVESSPLLRTIVKQMLASKGFEIAGVSSTPSETVDQYKKLKPDLVTIDVSTQDSCSEHNWIDAVKNILRLEPDARVVMVAASGQEKLLVDSFKAGVRDFVVKPFDPEKVATALERAVA